MQMMQRVRPTINHFSKSPFGRAVLKETGESVGETVYAMQKLGHTRFGSSTASVKSLSAVLSHVRTVVQNKTIKFKVCASLSVQGSDLTSVY